MLDEPRPVTSPRPPVMSAEAAEPAILPQPVERSRWQAGPTAGQRVLRELLSWVWVALAFLLITGTMVQARVIPSGSMENTLLVGDHLLMSRIGYDASVPFTQYHCASGASRTASR